MLFGVLNRGAVAIASAAMMESVTFVMRALNACQQTSTCFTCIKAYVVPGLHPMSLDVVPQRPDVHRSDDDHQTAIQVKHPGRAFTGLRGLTSDAWAARVQECGGIAGLVAGDAEASTVPAIDLVIGRDKLVRATPLGSFHAHEGKLLEGGPSRRSRK
jgi:hypothetical protein